LIKVDINGDFDKLNPIIAISADIGELRKQLSIGEYNKCMWSIFMLEYPLKKINPKAEIPYDLRLIDIQKGYNANFNPKDPYVKAASTSFSQYCLSFEENMFKIQKDKLDEFTAHFRGMDMATEFKTFIEASKSLPSIWKNFEKVRDDMIKSEKHDLKALGDVQLSKSEQKRIDQG